MIVRVLGLGNVLMGDDAAGPWVVALLDAGWEVPAEVEVLDLGTPGLDLLPYVTRADAVVIVDTVASEAPPGALRCYRRDAILRVPPQPRLSPHDPGLKEALFAAELASESPRDLLLVGIVPSSVAMGVGLTPSVRDALPRAVDAVVAELERLGVPPRRRARVTAPRIWWEQDRAASAAGAP